MLSPEGGGGGGHVGHLILTRKCYQMPNCGAININQM